MYFTRRDSALIKTQVSLQIRQQTPQANIKSKSLPWANKPPRQFSLFHSTNHNSVPQKKHKSFMLCCFFTINNRIMCGNFLEFCLNNNAWNTFSLILLINQKVCFIHIFFFIFRKPVFVKTFNFFSIRKLYGRLCMQFICFAHKLFI